MEGLESPLEKLAETPIENNENYNNEDKFISSDDIEKMVINLDEAESTESIPEPITEPVIEQQNSKDNPNNEIDFEIITPDGNFESVSEKTWAEKLYENEMIESQIEETRGINEREHLDSYYQPELVKEWEELYYSEQQSKENEEFLSQEALNDLQKSMDEIHKENLGGNLAETITEPITEPLAEPLNGNLTENIGEDPSKLGFHDQLAKAMDEIMSVDNNDLVSNEQAGEKLDIGLDLEMGNTIQDGMSSEFDTEIGEDLDNEEEADMNTTFDMDNSS